MRASHLQRHPTVPKKTNANSLKNPMAHNTITRPVHSSTASHTGPQHIHRVAPSEVGLMMGCGPSGGGL